MGLVRERREHLLFRGLLGMVPNLEERIMNGSSEEIKLAAELVGFSHLTTLININDRYRDSYKKALHVLGPTIRKA